MARSKRRQNYSGVLVIGDPHLEARQPGFRCDDYPETILRKIKWCLKYAEMQNLLPAFLGDFFDKPRDNPTWLIGRVIDLFVGREVIGIYGNHDCAEPRLTDNDSLSILIKAGCYRLVSQEDPWVGVMNEREVLIGGSSYREEVPEVVDRPPQRNLFDDSIPLIVWLTHHDIRLPGYESGRFDPFEIENCSLLINGHIHSRKSPIQMGQTVWMNPGNISRRNRRDLFKTQQPVVLHIEVTEEQHQVNEVVVPHEPFEKVFHPEFNVPEEEEKSSRFVDGLKELLNRKTESGAGLHVFLEKNLHRFSPAVASEIERLAQWIDEP